MARFRTRVVSVASMILFLGIGACDGDDGTGGERGGRDVADVAADASPDDTSEGDVPVDPADTDPVDTHDTSGGLADADDADGGSAPDDADTRGGPDAPDTAGTPGDADDAGADDADSSAVDSDVCVPTNGGSEACDGRDNDCDGKTDECCSTWYHDGDGDSYGDPNDTTQACKKPGNYVSNRKDCLDSDRNVHPGQTNYYPKANNAGGYDYNCDGTEEKEWTKDYATCSGRARCFWDKGWRGALVPACGDWGSFLHGCQFMGTSCQGQHMSKQQACR